MLFCMRTDEDKCTRITKCSKGAPFIGNFYCFEFISFFFWLRQKKNIVSMRVASLIYKCKDMMMFFSALFTYFYVFFMEWNVFVCREFHCFYFCLCYIFENNSTFSLFFTSFFKKERKLSVYVVIFFLYVNKIYW